MSKTLKIMTKDHVELARERFSITPSKAGREVKLELLGLSVAVSIDRLREIWKLNFTDEMVWLVEPTLDGLRAAHEALARLVRDGSGTFIPVSRAGKGPTEKSIKVTVEGVHHDDPDHYGPYAPSVVRRSHTITVAASQVVSRGEQLYTPRWLIMRAVHERILGGKKWPRGVDGAVWLEQEQFWTDFWAPLGERLEKILEAAAEKSRAEDEERAQRAALAEEEATRRKAQRETENARLNEAKKAAAEKHQAHLASLETLRADLIECDDWVDVKTKWGKQRKKVTSTFENCVLKFSGQRVYIVTADGEEIIKARSNVRWGAALKGVPQAASTANEI